MAEQIPFTIAENLLMKLGSTAFQEIGLMYGIRKELSKLEDTLSTIKAVLLDAGEPQERNRAVSTWVRRLKEVVNDADQLLDDFAAEDLRRKTHTQGRFVGQVSDFFSSSNHIAFRVKTGHRMKDIRERLDEIAKDISMFKFVPRVVQVENRKKSETHSFVLASEIVGREKDIEKMIGLLMQEHLSMVAIVGIGGLGKTTLAQLVYNDDEKVGKHFDIKIWVCVSNGFEVKAVVKNIVKATTNTNVNNLELDQLQKLLRKSLEGKRYLLVLDDVSNEDPGKWDQLRLLLTIGAHGSKILVTTRSARVASVMGINSPYNLEPLGEESSWDLFRSLAFKGGEEKARPNLVKIGKEIVKSCEGVPQVIRHVARMLHSKTEESQWLYVKNSKNVMSMDA
ncbi:putative disease resistance protein RGA3 [Vitis riparia]|uniref:putative disease resistance protein RGA3 n=1 Tax=Vitis riparia TaxID=96939 RepID=UPI00155ADA28|nr:putative disease resistance protein RGA3 [Vitis riparia]